ncbi:hypothetical protein KY290_000897 [Solanum tuberosum]|uniref:Uncharacterized protein n=1 Tax=Solanum tuberosum TaxID=4113 RepID=A0ABQ7WKL8_SOLTU|nr:hypothetical protein KY290_000897 [Solanum tuberosum]
MSEAQGINKQGERFENQMSTKEWISRSFHSHENEKQTTLPASNTSNTVDENQSKSEVNNGGKKQIAKEHSNDSILTSPAGSGGEQSPANNQQSGQHTRQKQASSTCDPADQQQLVENTGGKQRTTEEYELGGEQLKSLANNQQSGEHFHQIHATKIITTNAQVGEMKEWRTEDNNNATGDNALAIVEIPLAVEEALPWSESPNEVLHNILTHNVQEDVEVCGLLEAAEKDNITDQHEEQIHKDADLSPRVIQNLKYARKGKTQRNGEVPQPIRLQPNRGGGS